MFKSQLFQTCICFAGVSDSSTATPQPIISIEIQNNMRALYQRARELRTEVNKLRKMQINNSETMQETIYETFKKIKVRTRCSVESLPAKVLLLYLASVL